MRRGANFPPNGSNRRVHKVPDSSLAHRVSQSICGRQEGFEFLFQLTHSPPCRYCLRATVSHDGIRCTSMFTRRLILPQRFCALNLPTSSNCLVRRIPGTQLRERANADQQKAVEREDRNVRRRIKAIAAEHGPERSAERLAARQEGQRAANATTATQDKERPTAQSVDQAADRSSSTKPAKELSFTSDAVTASLVRGRTRAPAVGTDAEFSQERSETVKNGSDRPRRRSVGATRSVGASRRKRRTSVDAVAPPQS